MAPNSCIASVAQVAEVMDEWAPPWTTESWDRVGLLTGDPSAPAERVGVALELTSSVMTAALSLKLQMLLLHHPPLLKPLTNLRSDEPATARLLEAWAGGISLFAAHTNLDSAPHGVNHALAQRLGLKKTRPLVPAETGVMAKLVVFVPPSHLERVSLALFAAGAGKIGDYQECAFSAQGRGVFRAPHQGKPFVGKPGEKTAVDEVRLETTLPRALQSSVIKALMKVHPYEEPAYDLYPLDSHPAGFGLGRIGVLTQPRPGGEFMAWIARELRSSAWMTAGPVPAQVDRVAVVGGSGGDLLAAAAEAGAQMLITGEARHHIGQEAADLGICLAVMGHFATEEVVVLPWARHLGSLLRARGFACEVKPIRGADPWRGYV